MNEIAVCILFLAAVAGPFAAVGAVLGFHWISDRAWRQW